MKQKQREIIEKAKRDQKKQKLVDYTLNRIKNIKIAKISKTKSNFDRTQYNYSQFKRQGYKYSAWLAYRSMNYAK